MVLGVILGCCCFSHSAHWLPTRKKLLYTVANPARGLLNREKKEKEKVWQRYTIDLNLKGIGYLVTHTHTHKIVQANPKASRAYLEKKSVFSSTI